MLLGRISANQAEEALAFYAQNAGGLLLYPRTVVELCDHLEKKMVLASIRDTDGLVALGWISHFSDFVYLTIEDEHLQIHNDGPYTGTGGWCIHSKYRGSGVLKQLAGLILREWDTFESSATLRGLWARMAGIKDADGNPLFWNRVGAEVTGVPYAALLENPFGTMERTIWKKWPREPIPLSRLPQAVITETRGRAFPPLRKPFELFLQWGIIEETHRYVPTSLNAFHVTISEHLPNLKRFMADALEQAV